MNLEKVTTKESHTPTATLSLSLSCSHDNAAHLLCWLLITFKHSFSLLEWDFPNWIQSWVSGTCSVCLSCRVFVHKRIWLKCKLPLFRYGLHCVSLWPSLEIQSHSLESLLRSTVAGWTALLFRWMRPCFSSLLENETDTGCPCESLKKNVENQGLSEVTSKVLHVSVFTSCECELKSLDIHFNFFWFTLSFTLTFSSFPQALI